MCLVLAEGAREHNAQPQGAALKSSRMHVQVSRRELVVLLTFAFRNATRVHDKIVRILCDYCNSSAVEEELTRHT